MRTKLLNCLPGIRWVPHDLPETSRERDGHRSRFSLKQNPTSKPSKSKSKPKESTRFPTHRRKSTLSLNSCADEDLSSKTAPQLQSPFFASLPLEIRKMVYEYVVGPSEVVHLTIGAKRRYGHFLCEAHQIGVESGSEEGAGVEGDGFEEMGVDVVDEDEERVGVDCGCRVLVGGRESRRLEQSALAMVRVCRRMYSEAISSLYRPHTFSLLHITHLLYLPSRLPAPRLNNIRTLRLRWAIRALPFLRRPAHSPRYAYREDTDNWIRVWRMLADMTGLRDLYVVISDPSPQGLWQRSWCELEGKLLEPVKQVTRPRWFVLYLPYRECRTDWDMGDCKVELRKPDVNGVDDEGQ